MQDGGQIIPFDEFRSTVAGENLSYRVYIPPCYIETQKRYPYAILLHGLQENENQWGNLGIEAALDSGIRQGALAPMIVVMPNMGQIGTRNSFPPSASYETVVLSELMPAVERDFCTINDRDHRAIGGISRGGFWAFEIALRHPDIFGIVGGHSAAFDTGNAPAAFNPLELALNAPFLSSANLRMYLDNGADDPAGTNLELFSNRLSSRGIAHTYIISPVGGHDADLLVSPFAGLPDLLRARLGESGERPAKLLAAESLNANPFHPSACRAACLLADPVVPAAGRALLKAHRGAYLLGSVVADAHGLAGLQRDDTHFYNFDKPMEDHPWRVMLARYPILRTARDPDWRAFLAGYVLHLSMDEIWSLEMTGPEFAEREWAARVQRFLMLHILLIHMDERDLALLDPTLSDDLCQAHPRAWLPFLDDRVLNEWSSFMYRQLTGTSETLAVYGERLKQTPEALRSILDLPERMHDDLWAKVTPETTARVEAHMRDHARAQMITYLSEL